MCYLGDMQDVPESLVFLKIYTKGHEVPNDKTILSFKRAVHHFLQDNAENGKCTVSYWTYLPLLLRLLFKVAHPEL